ncbi:hypothetical protein ACFL5E_00065 [Candidatus Omnitrophota bacterium]
MTDKTIKYILITFTVIFAIRVTTIFTADRLHSMSMAAETGRIPVDRGVALINIATKLDSTNTNLYFKKYELLDIRAKDNSQFTTHNLHKEQLHLLERCIDLCPSWPAYHLYYAFTLIGMRPQPNILTQELILSELKKSTELKPYSALYRKIYKRYLEKYPAVQ